MKKSSIKRLTEMVKRFRNLGRLPRALPTPGSSTAPYAASCSADERRARTAAHEKTAFGRVTKATVRYFTKGAE